MKNTSSLNLINDTPLIRLDSLKNTLGLYGNIFAKVEGFNLTGSIKDRIVLYIINKLEKNKILKNGFTIIEATSGNTGIALSAIGAIKKIKVIIVMPENMSLERQKLIVQYGGKVILTPKELGMQGAKNKAVEISKNIKKSIIFNQFANEYNPLTHYEITGPEIYRQIDGKIDCFVAGIGTGGTISGISKYLKEQNKKIKIIGVEPLSSPLLTKGVAKSHKIQGIGANFVPKTLDLDVIDEIMDITDYDAKKYAQLVAKIEGLLVGYSSGAALKAAIKIAQKKENHNKNIVVIFPDNGNRYLSTDLFD